MYSSVPITAPNSVNIVFSVRRWSIALATPKSITLGTGLPSWSATSTFEGLIVSRWMIPFLVGMLNGLAGGDEEFEAFLGREVIPVGVLGNGHNP